MSRPHVATPGLAGSLVALGRQQAERLVAEARAEAEALREQARLEGHAEGREAAVREIMEAHAAWQATLRADIDDEIERRLQAWSNSLEQHLIDLSVDIARTVIGETMAEMTLPATVQRVREALHAMGQQQRATVLVSLEGRDALEEALRGAGLPVHELTIVGQPSIEPGFCRVESPHGVTDATLDVQMRRIRDHVTES